MSDQPPKRHPPIRLVALPLADDPDDPSPLEPVVETPQVLPPRRSSIPPSAAPPSLGRDTRAAPPPAPSSETARKAPPPTGRPAPAPAPKPSRPSTPPPRRIAPSTQLHPRPHRLGPFQEMVKQITELLPGQRPPRVKSENLAIFTRQFEAMLDAGIPLHRALNFFAEGGEESDLRGVIDKVCHSINSGSRLSAALRAHPQIFSEVYCSLVETGEQSGRLLAVLARLADILEKQVNMQKRLISTVTYPILLIAFCLVSVFFFVAFVLPMIEPIFTTLKVELPLPTRILLLSRVVLLPGVLLGFLSAALLWLSKPWIRAFLRLQPRVGLRLARLSLGLPLIGSVMEKIAVSRILYSLAGMIDAGIGLVPAIQRCQSVAGNAWISERMNLARLEIMDGALVSEAFSKYGALPSTAIHVIGVGEETSSISEMVSYAAAMFDEEAELALSSMAAMLEPIIMVGMGLVVGFIVLSAIMPTVMLLDSL